MSTPSKYWSGAAKRAVHERIAQMLRRLMDQESESDAFEPPVDEIGGFVVYTPEWRLIWHPDDGMGLSYSSLGKKDNICSLDPGLYAIPNRCDEDSQLVFRRIGMPTDFRDFEDTLFTVMVDRLELTPDECRRGCATAERLKVQPFDVSTMTIANSGSVPDKVKSGEDIVEEDETGLPPAPREES